MQKIGVGTDLVEIRRFEGVTEQSFTAFLSRNFSKEELDYCFSKEAPAQHLAARFAGKEAVIKALWSLGITDLFYPAIVILNDGKGVPYVRINTDKTEKLTIKISLSHSSEMALAFCIIIMES